MKNQTPNNNVILKAALAALLTVGMLNLNQTANASGGGNSGGSTKVVEARVTGYVTAIDYVTSTITIGASYYGSGALKVTSSTSISYNNVSCELSAIKLGDWVEARFEWASKTATKLSATGL